jgi:ribosomal protein S18 acetylase RimI-like enzyme
VSPARTEAREEPEFRARRSPAAERQSSFETASPKPELPAPVLNVRVAEKADAKALDVWLNATGKWDGVDANFQLVAKQGGVAIAVLDEVVGCCAWAMIPTLQHGLVGRITLILVEEGRRRRGIGRRLLSVAETALKKTGCDLVEVMSDIDLRNSHGFFRTLGFEQKSYRFIRRLSSGNEAESS